MIITCTSNEYTWLKGYIYKTPEVLVSIGGYRQFVNASNLLITFIHGPCFGKKFCRSLSKSKYMSNFLSPFGPFCPIWILYRPSFIIHQYECHVCGFTRGGDMNIGHKQIILEIFQFVMQAWNLVRNISGYYFIKKAR